VLRPACWTPANETGSEARDVVAVGESVKTIGAVRRIEGGAHARFGDDDVKVASGWMLHGNIALI